MSIRTQLALAVALVGSFGLPSCKPDTPSEDLDLRFSQRDGGSRDFAQPAQPSWVWESPLPQGNHLRGLFGVAGSMASEDELWAVGEVGTLLHRVRSSMAFRAEAGDLLDTRGLVSIAGSGSGDSLQLLTVGVYDQALLNVRGQWTEAQAPVSNAGSFAAVWGSQVGGEFYVVGTSGRIYHVRGTSWQREAQGLVSQYLGGVWGTGAGPTQEVYAVGASGKVLHKKDGTWTVEADGVTTQQLNAVVGFDTEVYAVGDGGTVLRKEGPTWVAEATPTLTSLTSVWGDKDEVYAAGQKGIVLRRQAGVWKKEAEGLTQELIASLWGVRRGTQSTVYAAGNLGTILRRDQGIWTTLSVRVTPASLSAVWARSSEEVYAVGASGVILRRRGSAQVGGWSKEGEGLTTEGLNAISGFGKVNAEAEVYVVGTGGTILHRLGGRWDIEGAVLTGAELTSVWASAEAVFAVGRDGKIAKKQDNRWTLESWPAGVPEVDLLGVFGAGSGPSLTVYAVGEGGVILRRFDGVWKREGEGLTDQSLTSVFGRSSEEVYVLGAKGIGLRRQNGVWGTEPLQLSGRTAVGGCAAPDGTYFAVATSGLLLRRDGSWIREGAGLTTLELTGISAISKNEVYAVGASGVIVHKR